MKKTLLSLLLLFIIIMNNARGAQLGLIEGFSWQSNDQVNGVYGKYTPSQRDALINSLQAPLNSYVFVPHDPSLSATYMWSSGERASWTKTITNAKNKNITVAVGLRPGWIDNVPSSLSLIINKINTDFIPTGVKEYVLAWDDTPGAGTTAQMNLQKNLIISLINNNINNNVKLTSIVPAAYYPGSDTQPTSGTWAQKLSVLDGVPTSVRFYVTGLQVNPSSLSPSNVPTLPSGRKFIMWDNWIATDTNSLTTMTFPPSRSPSLYTYGYGLNVAFPPERIIHQVKAFITRANSQPIVVSSLASQWTTYLASNGFLENSKSAQATTCITTIINDVMEENVDILQTCPVLQIVFDNDY